MSWQTKFEQPIPLPDGGELRTLHDARAYILGLPPAKTALPVWITATEALIMVANQAGPIDFARIGLMRALHPREPAYDTSRKDPHWGRRKLARDR